MSPTHFRRGFSPVVIIVIVFILAGLGVGAWYAYPIYIEPMLNPLSKLIPPGLKEYAKGEDADVFMILRNDAALREQLSKIPQGTVYTDFEGGILLADVKKTSFFLALSFSTPESASSMKAYIETLTKTSPIPVQTEDKDKIVTVSFGAGISVFKGSLLDNERVKNLDPAMLDSQFIAYIDNANNTEVNVVLYSLLNAIFSAATFDTFSLDTDSLFPVAHAQGETTLPANIPLYTPSKEQESRSAIFTAMNGLLSLAGETTIFLRLADDEASIKMTIRTTGKEGLGEMMKQMGSRTMTEEEISGAYDTLEKSIADSMPYMKEALAETSGTLAGAKASIDYTGGIFTLDGSVPVATIETRIREEIAAIPEREAKSRDNIRQINLQSIRTTIETYGIKYDKYPDTSGCIDQLADKDPNLKSLFYKNTPPDDPSGEQTIGSASCQGGYYYQSFGENGYVLWAKMEFPENNNATMTPEVLQSQLTAGKQFIAGKTGTYYILNVYGPNPTQKKQQTSTTKNAAFTMNTDDLKKINYSFTLSPGDAAVNSVTLVNLSDIEANVLVHAADSLDKLYKRATDRQEYFGKWTTFSQTEVTLSPKESKQINLTIEIPVDAEPGEYKGIIAVQPVQPENKDGYAVTSRIAQPIKVTVK